MDETYTSLEQKWIRKAAAHHIPLTANFELLPLCNMSCDMCYIHLSPTEMKKQGNLMTADEWLSIARQFSDAGTLFVLLTGGEPLLFPDFKRLYLALIQMGMIVTVNTNGTLIDEEWADFFGENKPRRINITLYGSSPETYRKLCHFQDGYERTMKGIRLLKERHVDVKMNASIVKANATELEDLYRIGEELDVPVTPDTYMLPGLHERKLSFSDQTRLEPEDAARMRWKVWQKEHPDRSFALFAEHLLRAVENPVYPYARQISCQACSTSCAVNWQGYLRPCVTLQSPSIDLKKVPVADAWEMLYAESRDMLLNEKCTHCMLRPLCDICAGNSYAETGCYDGIPEYCCRMSEELYRLLCEYQSQLQHPQNEPAQ